MTTVTFYESDGCLYGFEESGHSGYAEAGSDIVCAAVSAMTMLVVNAIRDSYGAAGNLSVSDADAYVRFSVRDALPGAESSTKQYAISGLISAYYRQLRELARDYDKFLSVRVRPVPWSAETH